MKRNARFLICTLLVFFFVTLTAQNSGPDTPIRFRVLGEDGALLHHLALTSYYEHGAESKSLLLAGEFDFSITDTLSYIAISHLSYKSLYLTRKEMLAHLAARGNEVFILRVEPAYNKLEQVDVQAPAPFYQDQNHLLLDYEILNNGRVLLLMERQIYLVDQQDSLLRIIPNPMRVTRAARACTGKLYLANDRFLYPTFYDDKTFLVSDDPVPLNGPGQELSELVACDTCLKIREAVGGHNQIIVYKVQVNDEPGNEALLYCATDPDMLALASAEFYELSSGAVPDRMGELTGPDLAMAREHNEKMWKFSFFTSKKLYAPVFIKGDSIFVFDYGIKQVTVFKYIRQGKIMRFNTILKAPLEQDKKKGWMKTIIQDYKTGEMYGVYRDRSLWLEKLCYFGETPQQIELPAEHYFAGDIRMFDRKVYYLWRDPSRVGTTKTLYRR